MREKVFLTELPNQEEIAQILRIIAENRFLSHTGLAGRIEGYDGKPSRFSDFVRKRGKANTIPTRMSDVERKVFLDFIENEMDTKDWLRLYTENQALTKRLTAPNIRLTNAVSSWLGSYFETTEALRNRSGIQNGHFLILRLDQKGELISSWMRILEPSPESPLPRFVTTRQATQGLRKVKGVFFESDRLFYTFGKSTDHGGFRATIQQPVKRSESRSDMFGVRLGQQADNDFPYAYPIYCYQLKRKRGRVLSTLTGKKSFDDKYLIENIENLEAIITRLKKAASSPLGVMFGEK